MNYAQNLTSQIWPSDETEMKRMWLYIIGGEEANNYHDCKK